MQPRKVTKTDLEIVDVLYAKEDFKSAMEIIPEDPEPVFYYAQQLLEKPDVDVSEVIRCYKTLKKLDADSRWMAEITSKLEILSSGQYKSAEVFRTMLEKYINTNELNVLCQKYKNDTIFADAVIEFFQETPLWEIDKNKNVFENRQWAKIADIRHKISFSETQKNMLKKVIRDAYESNLRPENYDRYLDRYFRLAGCILGENGDFFKSISEADLQGAKKALSLGANINTVNEYGQTALMSIIEYLPYAKNKAEFGDFIGAIKFLLKKGIDVSIKDNDGIDTALSLAINKDLKEVVEILLTADLTGK